MAFETSEQYEALRLTQMKRDYANAMKALTFLIERNPFEDCIHLINVETEEDAKNSVNVYDAKCIANTITVFNFQSMKSPVELNSLFWRSLCYTPGLLYQLIRSDTGQLAKEAFTSNSIVSSKL